MRWLHASDCVALKHAKQIMQETAFLSEISTGTVRNDRQETAFLVQIALQRWFLVFHFGGTSIVLELHVLRGWKPGAWKQRPLSNALIPSARNKAL
eukprot:3857247-Rhodomonas_salina.6